MKTNSEAQGRLVVVDGVRTPFSKMGTGLARVDAVELGRMAVGDLVARTGLDPGLVDELIFGCVCQPADAMNIARVVALRAGLPERMPALTVHRNCASGIEALTTAFEKMRAGAGEVFIVGGTESMSGVPLLFKQAAAAKFATLARSRSPLRRIGAMAAFRPADFMPLIGLQLGLTDPVVGLNMGQTAEVLAREFDISRHDQDAFALESHRRAVAARDKLVDEICPVFDVSGRAPKLVAADNGPRDEQSMEALAKLKPVFDRALGTVTAGNSSQITDGAVALLVMSERKADALGLPKLGALTGYAYTGCDPKRMGLGPVEAIATASERLGLTLADADLVEINEAFAAQVLAVLAALRKRTIAGKPGHIEPEILNPNGGSIALGHPVGATGARLVLTSLKELERSGGRRALVSLCVGGGQGGAVWLERT